jgi:hypothetical protein
MCSVGLTSSQHRSLLSIAIEFRSDYKPQLPPTTIRHLSTRPVFAEVLLEAPTIVMVLPLESAHWAIVKEWAEPHYLQSFELVPAGTVVVYTPRNRAELEVCYSLLFESYHFACKSPNEKPIQPWPQEQTERLALC